MNAMATEHRNEAGDVAGNHGNHELINTADTKKTMCTHRKQFYKINSDKKHFSQV